MSLIYDDSPVQGEHLVSLKTQQLITQESPETSFFGSAAFENLQISQPHAMYDCSLEEIANGQLIEKVEHFGWRYLIFKGESALLSAELLSPMGAESVTFSNFYSGEMVTQTIRALEVAEKLPDISNTDYTIRFLQIPLLHVLAIWLSGPKDILIPLLPHHSLEPLKPYSESDFLQVLQEPAQQLVKDASGSDTDI